MFPICRSSAPAAAPTSPSPAAPAEPLVQHGDSHLQIAGVVSLAPAEPQVEKQAAKVMQVSMVNDLFIY